ncbi:outer membrane protein [Bartonella sp. CB169]|uniref:outer membrane protein n=1 Tax=Bartonella sp. CB169 TaxID=3112257 RepID=UPI00300DE0B5
MNMKRLITASAFAFVSASAAHAADVIVPQNPTPVAPVIVAPTFSWTGFYLGGQVGNFASKPKMDILAEKNILINKEFVPKPSGFIGGLYAGSNIDLSGGLILGVDTDIMWSDKDDTKAAKAYGIVENQLPPLEEILKGVGINVGGRGLHNGDKVVHSFTLREKWSGATRVRLGFAAERIMPYIAGGIAYTQLQDIKSILITEKDKGGVLVSGNLSDEKKTLVGYTLGAGVDLAVTNNVVLRAEYRYSDFGKKKFSKDKYETAYKTNDFRVGVAYKF